jgi:hypothetical protein
MRAETLAVLGERMVSSRRRRSIHGEEGVHMGVISEGVPFTALALVAAPEPPAAEIR